MPDVWQERYPRGVLVGLQGRLDHSLTPQLEATLRTLLEEGHPHLLIDLSAVTYMNSSGLRVLVSTWRKSQKAGGEIALCGLNDRLLHLFATVGFDELFTLFPTHDQAVEEWLVSSG